MPRAPNTDTTALTDLCLQSLTLSDATMHSKPAGSIPAQWEAGARAREHRPASPVYLSVASFSWKTSWAELPPRKKTKEEEKKATERWLWDPCVEPAPV